MDAEEDYYPEFIEEWNRDRARAEAEWERWVSGYIEVPEEEEEEWNTGS